ncbi:MAG: hypothetical protein M1823_005791 [Watsoniomyces obsoletus]|nr:MAG: hypothetical protein M1823_005791 [Watsoniomyces obsoletus]
MATRGPPGEVEDVVGIEVEIDNDENVPPSPRTARTMANPARNNNVDPTSAPRGLPADQPFTFPLRPSHIQGSTLPTTGRRPLTSIVPSTTIHERRRSTARPAFNVRPGGNNNNNDDDDDADADNDDDDDEFGPTVRSTLSPQYGRSFFASPTTERHRGDGSQLDIGNGRQPDQWLLTDTGVIGVEGGASSAPGPPPPASTPTAAGTARRGHRHRRSGAISHHDLSGIFPTPQLRPVGRAESAPTSPVDVTTTTHTTPFDPVEPDRRGSMPEAASPRTTEQHSMTLATIPPRPTTSGATRPRVGFADRVEFIRPRPLSTLSDETSSSSQATVRGERHSVNNSISSIVSADEAITGDPTTTSSTAARPHLLVVEEGQLPPHMSDGTDVRPALVDTSRPGRLHRTSRVEFNPPGGPGERRREASVSSASSSSSSSSPSSPVLTTADGQTEVHARSRTRPAKVHQFRLGDRSRTTEGHQSSLSSPPTSRSTNVRPHSSPTTSSVTSSVPPEAVPLTWSSRRTPPAPSPSASRRPPRRRRELPTTFAGGVVPPSLSDHSSDWSSSDEPLPRGHLDHGDPLPRGYRGHGDLHPQGALGDGDHHPKQSLLSEPSGLRHLENDETYTIVTEGYRYSPAPSPFGGVLDSARVSRTRSSTEWTAPIIDLDVAFGGSSAARPGSSDSSVNNNSQPVGGRRRLHSRGVSGGYAGISLHDRRRTESAPELLTPELGRTGLPRWTSSSTMADVFEEDEEEDENVNEKASDDERRASVASREMKGGEKKSGEKDGEKKSGEKDGEKKSGEKDGEKKSGEKDGEKKSGEKKSEERSEESQSAVGIGIDLVGSERGDNVTNASEGMMEPPRQAAAVSSSIQGMEEARLPSAAIRRTDIIMSRPPQLSMRDSSAPMRSEEVLPMRIRYSPEVMRATSAGRDDIRSSTISSAPWLLESPFTHPSNRYTPSLGLSTTASPDLTSGPFDPVSSPSVFTSASSLIDERPMQSPVISEPNMNVRMSAEDVPSLTASSSARTSAVQSYTGASSLRPGSNDGVVPSVAVRTGSATSEATTGSMQATPRPAPAKRSSLASLSRLVPGGSSGQRSQLSIEQRASTSPESPEKDRDKEKEKEKSKKEKKSGFERFKKRFFKAK